MLGGNGAGKTTLLRTLLGLLAPLAGSVTVDGTRVDAMAPSARARRLAYVPQQLVQPFAFSVRETVLIGGAARLSTFARPGTVDRAAADAALERLRIASLAERPVTELSGGERQLTLIARALAQEAPILVLDEPTASLDFGNRARVLGELDRLRDSGLAIVFSTHDPEHALAHADRALLLADGRALACDVAERALSAETPTRLYGIAVRRVDAEVRRRLFVPAWTGALARASAVVNRLRRGPRGSGVEHHAPDAGNVVAAHRARLVGEGRRAREREQRLQPGLERIAAMDTRSSRSTCSGMKNASDWARAAASIPKPASARPSATAAATSLSAVEVAGQPLQPASRHLGLREQLLEQPLAARAGLRAAIRTPRARRDRPRLACPTDSRPDTSRPCVRRAHSTARRPRRAFVSRTRGTLNSPVVVPPMHGGRGGRAVREPVQAFAAAAREDREAAARFRAAHSSSGSWLPAMIGGACGAVRDAAAPWDLLAEPCVDLAAREQQLAGRADVGDRIGCERDRTRGVP